ncbi:DUF2497 domain-containing protein [Falsiroseomonas selenitidurans]|nr:DUF2497 domain-containing protein [Falsiroseomonas selenitidurans]
MSGGQPPKPGPGGSDPAMDDILASIRRILNEDEANEQPPGAAEPEPLDLTEAMLVAAPADPPAPEAEAVPEPEPPPAAPAPQPEPPAPPAAPPQPAPVPVGSPPAQPPAPQAMSVDAVMSAAEGLIAPAVAAATTASLASLLRSVASERTAPVHRGGPSIEDVVREELRPLLKTWLDEHLPPLVERLVRVEIERVIGRAMP